MSDTVKQEVLVEFLSAIHGSFSKSFKEVADALKSLGVQSKEASKAVNDVGKSTKNSSKDNVAFGSTVDKVSDSHKRYRKVLSELRKDFSSQEAGLSSVKKAFAHYTSGVEKGHDAINIGRKRTIEYMTALLGTSNVLTATDKSWVSWAKNVKFSSIAQAEAAGKIALTRQGIQLLTADAGKSIGLTKEQISVLQKSTLAQDVYSKKLRESALRGTEYAASFQTMARSYGTNDKAVLAWSSALEKANKGLGDLRLHLRTTKAGSTDLVDGLKTSSVAIALLNGHLKTSGSSFRIFNEYGLKALGLTEDQAAKMKMLSSSYSLYGTTVQKMQSSGNANLRVFKNLTDTYGRGDLVVRQVSSSIQQMEKIVSGKVILAQQKLNAQVAAGTMTQEQADRALRKYSSSLDKTSIAQEEFLKVQQKNGASARTFTNDMSKASTFSEQYQAAMQGFATQFGKNTSEYKDHALALTTVEKAIKRTSADMIKAGMDGKTWADSIDRQKATIDLLNGSLSITNGRFTEVAKTIPDLQNKGTGLAGVFQKIGDSLMNVAKYAVSAFAFYGLISVMKGATDTIIDYDQALHDLQAITGATDYQTAMFGETIKTVAANTKFSAQEIAEGMKFLGQAGFSASETIKVIADVATLATGTLSDLSLVADLLTTTIRAFHLEASESANLIDIFAGAINKSKLDVDKLRVAFNYFASVADKANISVTDSVTLMSLLANAGVRASTIGTSLRQVVEGLVSPNKEFTEAIKRSGFAVEDFDPSLNKLEDVIRRLVEVVPDAAAAFDLFGIRGAPAVSALTTNGVAGFLQMRESIEQAGAAAAMAELQMEGLGNKSKNLKDKFGLLALAIGDAGLKAALEGIIDAARWLVGGLTDLINIPVAGFTLAIGALAAALAMAINAGKAFLGLTWVSSIASSITSVVGFTAVINTLKVAMATLAFTNGITLASLGLWAGIAAVVGVVAVGFMQLKKKSEDILAITQKNKDAYEEEIKVLDRKTVVIQGLISVAKDSLKTDAQRTVALDKLAAMGVEVNGVLRDQKGIITNLDEVVKANTKSFENYRVSLEKLKSEERAKQFLEDAQALDLLTKKYEEAAKKLQEVKKQGFVDPLNPDLAKEDAGFNRSNVQQASKDASELGNALDSAEQKIQEIVQKYLTMSADAWKQEMLRAGASSEEVEKLGKNFNNLDSKYLEMWVRQTGAMQNFAGNAETALNKLKEVFGITVTQITSSVDYQYSKITQSMTAKLNEFRKSVTKVDDPKQAKTKDFYTGYLAQVQNGTNVISGIFEETRKQLENLPGADPKWVEEKIEQSKQAIDAFNAQQEEDRKTALGKVKEFIDLETQAKSLGYDNQIAALEASRAQEIGNEHDTANAIVALRGSQIQAQIAGHQQYLEHLKATSPNEIAEIQAENVEIMQLQAQQAALSAEMYQNTIAKQKEEQEKEEKKRVFEHKMELLDIEESYVDKVAALYDSPSAAKLETLKMEMELSQAKLVYIEEEIRLLQEEMAIRVAKGQETIEIEEKINDLILERRGIIKEISSENQEVKIVTQEAKEEKSNKAKNTLELWAQYYENMAKAMEKLAEALHMAADLAEDMGNISAMYDYQLKEQEALLQAVQYRKISLDYLIESKGVERGILDAQLQSLTSLEDIAYKKAQIAVVDSEVAMLQMDKLKLLQEEQAILQKIKDLTAEKNMDALYLMMRGLQHYNVENWKDMVKFYKDLLPDAFDAAGKAFGDMVVKMVHGEAKWRDVWDGVRQALSEAVDQILADMIRLWSQRLLLSTLGFFTGIFSGGGNAPGLGSTSTSFLHGSLSLFNMFADGGEVPGYSPNPRADNIPIMATAREFIQPVPTVDYYGKGIMEAMRTRSIPREVFAHWAKPTNKSGGRRYADGGEVSGSGENSNTAKDAQSLQIVNILDPAMFDQYVSSHAGQKAIMNVISRNPAIIKGILR